MTTRACFCVSPAVTGIELLNEPFASVDLSFIQAFYLAGYPLVRPQSSAPAGEGLDLYIHDAFRLGSWGGFMQPPEFQNVYLDTHLYHVFDRGLLQMSQQQHLDFQCTQVAAQQAQAAKNLWLVTGEWSLATTDCAKCKKSDRSCAHHHSQHRGRRSGALLLKRFCA